MRRTDRAARVTGDEIAVDDAQSLGILGGKLAGPVTPMALKVPLWSAALSASTDVSSSSVGVACASVISPERSPHLRFSGSATTVTWLAQRSVLPGTELHAAALTRFS